MSAGLFSAPFADPVPVRLLCVLGTSAVSTAIAVLGTSDARYSHVAVIDEDGTLVEARERHVGADGASRDGVLSERTVADAVAEARAEGARVDVATFLVPSARYVTARMWLRAQIGAPYDYLADAALAVRHPLPMPADGTDPAAWMCSSLAFAFLRRCGLLVLGRTTPRSCDPSRLALAPDARWSSVDALLAALAAGLPIVGPAAADARVLLPAS